MRTFTVRLTAADVAVDHTVAVTAAGIPLGSTGAHAPTATALCPLDAEHTSIDRASVVSAAEGLRVIAERRDDRRSKTQNALVLLDASSVTGAQAGFSYRCPAASGTLTVTKARFLRRPVVVAAKSCPTCARELNDGNHPPLDSPQSGVEVDGALTVAAASGAAAYLVVLRPGARLELTGAVIDTVAWDGANLIVESSASDALDEELLVTSA